MIVTLGDSLQKRPENANGDLIKDLVKAASAIMEKRIIRAQFYWPFDRESYLIVKNKQFFKM